MSSTLNTNSNSNSNNNTNSNYDWSLITTENMNMSHESDFANSNHCPLYFEFDFDDMDEPIIYSFFENGRDGEFEWEKEGRFFIIRQQQRPYPKQYFTKPSVSFSTSRRTRGGGKLYHSLHLQ